MLVNRSMPAATIIPVLVYPDLPAAIAWLCQAFSFSERLRIGNHRAQLSFGTGAIVVVQREPNSRSTSSEPAAHAHSIMVRVERWIRPDTCGRFHNPWRMSIRRRGVARWSEILARRPSMEHP